MTQFEEIHPEDNLDDGGKDWKNSETNQDKYEKAKNKLDLQKTKEKKELISETRKKLDNLKKDIIETSDKDPQKFIAGKIIRLRDVYTRESKNVVCKNPWDPFVLNTVRDGVQFHISNINSESGENSYEVTVTDKWQKSTYLFVENLATKTYSMTGNKANAKKYISML